MDVAWPGWRMDVVAGLEVLAADPPELREGRWDPRTPNVADAVAWLVDDMGWESRGSADVIGRSLRDDQEVWLLHSVADVLVRVADRQTVVATDAAWFADDRWPLVRSRASEALNVLRVNDGVRG
ncbi:MAG: hypothetical protein QOF57_2833 [Frankiaceae bacterium]|jgi:hypothetical protein|nr:hypothetical protein [Frankiaceae bacterium]